LTSEGPATRNKDRSEMLILDNFLNGSDGKGDVGIDAHSTSFT